MALGDKGVITTVGDIVPRAMSELTDACLAGEWTRGRRIQMELIPVTRAVFVETNPMPIKQALGLMGKADGKV